MKILFDAIKLLFLIRFGEERLLNWAARLKISSFVKFYVVCHPSPLDFPARSILQFVPGNQHDHSYYLAEGDRLRNIIFAIYGR